MQRCFIVDKEYCISDIEYIANISQSCRRLKCMIIENTFAVSTILYKHEL